MDYEYLDPEEKLWATLLIGMASVFIVIGVMIGLLAGWWLWT